MSRLHELMVPLRGGGERRIQLPEGQAHLVYLRLRGEDWGGAAWNARMTRKGALAVRRIILRKLLAVGVDTPLLDPDPPAPRRPPAAAAAPDVGAVARMAVRP